MVATRLRHDDQAARVTGSTRTPQCPPITFLWRDAGGAEI
jgi:hypothetical protein